MRRFGLLLVVIALMAPRPALAQDLDCDAEELRPWLENYLAWANAAADVVTAVNSSGGVYDVELFPYMLLWHTLQSRLDQPGRPACADALMLETLRNYQQAEHIMLCYNIDSPACAAVLRSADEITSRAALPIPYIAAANMTTEGAADLRPEDWSLAAFFADFGLTERGEPGESPIGSRSNPFEPGEWAPFSEGRIRTLPVDNDYQARREPDLGMRFIAIPVEYECYQEDENEVCAGSGGYYVGVDGLVVDRASVYDAPAFNTLMEGYSGAVLKGNIYFEVPSDAELGQLRLRLDGEHVFFELVPAE